MSRGFLEPHVRDRFVAQMLSELLDEHAIFHLGTIRDNLAHFVASVDRDCDYMDFFSGTGNLQKVPREFVGAGSLTLFLEKAGSLIFSVGLVLAKANTFFIRVRGSLARAIVP